MRPDLHKSIEKELENAERARSNENEGMARVCARRAAGWAAEEYLKHGRESNSAKAAPTMR